MNQIILINIAGEDKPGLTSAISKILSEYHVNILDIGQAVIHNMLALGFLVELPPEAESSPVIKDVLFCAHKLGVKMTFTPIDSEAYEQWVQAQGKPRYLITMMARKITSEQIASVAAVIAENGLNIDKIARLSGRIPLGETEQKNKACVELSVRGAPKDLQALRTRLLQITDTLGLDIAFQEDNVFYRHRRLVVFDMDSTLIQAEVIDELAKEAGVGEAVAGVTESAMRGEIDFDESLKQRVAKLKGLDVSVLGKVAERLKLTEGAETLLQTLKKLGFKTAILSGGFTYFGQYLKQRLGIDYVHANELEIVDGKLTGKVIGPIVNGQRKADLLKSIAQVENIQPEQIIAVGDGANDLPMLSVAGLGIAFRAKPLVRQTAKQAISTLGLDSILYLLGFHDRDQSIHNIAGVGR